MCQIGGKRLDESQQQPTTEGDGDGTLARLKAVRRGSGAVFGDTPIQMPPPQEQRPEGGEEEHAAPLEPRVRHAAINAALKTGALAVVAGVFMGFVLMCSLGGLMGGSWALSLGFIVMITAGPVALIAAYSTYRQTLEVERHKVGLCPRCGYDLRGSVGMRCPECGTKITTPGSTRAPWTEEDQQRESFQ